MPNLEASSLYFGGLGCYTGAQHGSDYIWLDASMLMGAQHVRRSGLSRCTLSLCAAFAILPGCGLSSSYSVAPQTARNSALYMSAASAKAKFKEYTVPTAQSEPYKMVLGPDGRYWFTEFAANKIAGLTP